MESANSDDNTPKDIALKINEYIANIAAQEGFTQYEVEKRNLSSKGGSYLGILFEIDIRGKTLHGDKETSIFIKNIIVADHMIFSVEQVYKRELFVYKELSKVFDKLQRDANIPENNRFKMARVYEASTDQAIILENLSKTGFKTWNRMDITSLEFAQAAITNLARFHALSFAMEDKMPDFFNDKIKTIDLAFKLNDVWTSFSNKIITASLECLEASVKEKYESSIIKKADKYFEYMCDSKCVRTLCHGDYRPNNIMVKENIANSSVIAVDYQIVHFGNPVVDFIYFFMWSTDQEFRKKHLESLKDLYHNTLKEFLGHFCLKVDNVLPREEFEKQFREKLGVGIYVACAFLPFLFPPENDVPDLSNFNDVLTDGIQVESKFKNRFRGIIDDFIQWGYL